ncbi:MULTISPECIES: hypothetical protein [Candidatus Phytoplasma]|uniref:Uncharacterized protein n=1 Tax='Catharanthus roseus' aster yellows phytoplasma TaxID=1193712 RepID=A0A4P6MA36_9MOLU|nr:MULTISPECIES: hypothetical protein [Phytoplasma]OIJ44954.1 hypothetical protein BHE82_00070 [Rice orange leaf phytoplasma]QBF23660.1 hypothetical protein EXT02_00210 ['Catharanthus roseus' aster yellows phytoplasma]
MRYAFVSYGPYKVQEGYNPKKWVFVKNKNDFTYDNPQTNLPKTVEVLIAPLEEHKTLLKQHKLSFVVPFMPREFNYLDIYTNHPGLKPIFSSDFISLFRVNIENDENDYLKKVLGY